MNTMLNINPWSVLSELLDANSRAFKSMTARAAGKFPPVNVYISDNAVIVDLELPGKTAKDVDLSLEPQAVRLITIITAISSAMILFMILPPL